MIMAKTVLLSKDDYRQFTINVGKLTEQGYDFAHEVEYMEDGTFKIRVLEDHDYDALDEMME